MSYKRIEISPRLHIPHSRGTIPFYPDRMSRGATLEMSHLPRVVITGMGVCSSAGTGQDRFFDALIEGKSGIDVIRSFDASALRSRIAGEVTDCDLASDLNKKTFRRTARFTHLALKSSQEAIEQAQLQSLPVEDVAVVVGSGIGGIDVYEVEHQTFIAKGPGKHHPLTIPLVLPNMAAAAISKEFGFLGVNLCVSTACSSGANSIGAGFDLIRTGRAKAVLAGSTESTLSSFCIDGYCQLRALSTRNDTPQTASRPFSLDRDGFVLAEGAGILVLEDYDHAKARGAEILAELAGYGASADGYHLTAPDPLGGGAMRAMNASLKDAQLSVEDIDVINAHGTSTPLGDLAECKSIEKTFGAHAKKLVVHSTKSMTGHSLGASASIEAVAAVQTLRRQVVHPTTNLVTPDPACDLDFNPSGSREMKVDTVLSNSFAFGGHTATLIFKRFL